MKRALTIILTACLLLSSLCLTASAESVQVPELVVGIAYDVATLAPWDSASSGRLNLMQTVYEYMAYYDSTQECGMNGILMESYEKLDAYTSRVKIFDYIYDSAGNHMTADDVVFSFTTWRDNGKSVKCKLLESVTKVDEYTVDIKLNADTVGDVENMLCGLVPVVTKAAYEASDDGMYAHVVSTSPYIVSEFVEGDHITVLKNENYWQTNDEERAPMAAANADKITFKIITETAQTSINLETNVIDAMCLMPSSEVGRFEDSSDYTVESFGGSNFGWIAFNMDPEQGLFYDNLALRQAIAYAIDTNGIVLGALNGRGQTPHAYANPECVDYNPEWDTQDYYGADLDKAKALLSESGFDTGKPIRLMYTSGSAAKNSATIIQGMLLQLGIQTELLGYETALFQTYKTEPAQWDIILDEVQSVDFVSSAASKLDNRNPAVNFAQDETLQNLVETIMTNEGHTAENIEAYMNYVKDNCLVYAIYRANTTYVAEKGISSVAYNFKGWPIPGAFEFTADFVR